MDTNTPLEQILISLRDTILHELAKSRLALLLVDGEVVAIYQNGRVRVEYALKHLFPGNLSEIMLTKLDDGTFVYERFAVRPDEQDTRTAIVSGLIKHGWHVWYSCADYVDVNHVVVYRDDDPQNEGYGFFAVFNIAVDSDDVEYTDLWVNICPYGLEGWEPDGYVDEAFYPEIRLCVDRFVADAKQICELRSVEVN